MTPSKSPAPPLPTDAPTPAAAPGAHLPPTQPDPPPPPKMVEWFRRKRVRNTLLVLSVLALSASFAQPYLEQPWAKPLSGGDLLKEVVDIATALIAALTFFLVTVTYEMHNRMDEYHHSLSVSEGAMRGSLDEFHRTLGDSERTIKTDVSEAISQVDRHLNVAADDIKRELDRTKGHLDNVVECRYLGPGREALAEVLNRLRTAKSVRNTFVLFGVGEREAYAASQFEEVNQKISEFLKQRGSWTDIVSQDVINSPTGRWLKFLSDLHAEARHSRDAGARTEARVAIERYLMRYLKGIYPLINFMLVEHSDEKGDEVIFGWGHHSADPGGQVFLSRSPKLLKTFNDYWNILKKDSVPLKPHSTPVTPAEITGLWFRVSYLGDAAPGRRARPGIPPADDERLHDVALVHIGIEENRNLVVKGQRFEITGDGEAADSDPPAAQPRRIRPTKDFRSRGVDLENSELWFSTTSGSDEDLQVAGRYRFARDEATLGDDIDPNFSGGVRIQGFVGEFVEYQENMAGGGGAGGPAAAGLEPQGAAKPFKYQVGRLLVYGRRVPKSWLESCLENEAAGEEPSGGGKKASDFLPNMPDNAEVQLTLIKCGWQWWNAALRRSRQSSYLEADAADAGPGAEPETPR